MSNIKNEPKIKNPLIVAIREQLETAKAEVGKPFPQEDELKTKSARLIELNAELDIEKQTKTAPVEEKAEKPSIPSVKFTAFTKPQRIKNAIM